MTSEEKQEDRFFELLGKLQDAQQMLFDMGRIYATAYMKRKAIPVDYDQMCANLRQDLHNVATHLTAE